MAHTLSAEKRIRQSKKRRMRNRQVKSTIKTGIKKFLSAIDKKNKDQVKNELKNVYTLLDKAVSKGVIHKNNAARRKSRLAKKAVNLLR